VAILHQDNNLASQLNWEKVEVFYGMFDKEKQIVEN